jgi:mannose/cellobiose epimerase-like protein (N-acyl-D-glucosamine 2-epimerase family)
MPARLTSAADALRDWATGAALPLWATAGFDVQPGRFEERLTLRAERLPDVPLRLMSQARQIYAYAVAARRGWYPDAGQLVEHAYASMVRDYHGRDDRSGWIFSIRRDGAVADARRDLYTHAFVLLAIAAYVEATGKHQALGLADETLGFIERHMTAPQGGGFVEELPSPGGSRRQNPHMHLFEAMLLLWECSGDARYRARADTLFDLFASRFFRSDPGVLGEHFTPSLTPAEGIAGRVVEPGHHYEWIWLLRRFERASGRSMQRYVDALYAHADRHGFDEAGLIVDELLIDGSHHKRSRRIWPIAEAIRANVVEARWARAGSAAKAASLAVRLRQRFLTTDPAGGWFDKLDADGACISRFMPASTLYHLVGAIDELDQPAASASDARPGATESVQRR